MKVLASIFVVSITIFISVCTASKLDGRQTSFNQKSFDPQSDFQVDPQKLIQLYRDWEQMKWKIKHYFFQSKPYSLVQVPDGKDVTVEEILDMLTPEQYLSVGKVLTAHGATIADAMLDMFENMRTQAARISHGMQETPRDPRSLKQEWSFEASDHFFESEGDTADTPLSKEASNAKPEKGAEKAKE